MNRYLQRKAFTVIVSPFDLRGAYYEVCTNQQEIGIAKYTSQAKMLFRKLNRDSPKTCSLESGEYMFNYLIQNDVVFLCLCEKKFPAKSAFLYIEELAHEFLSQYGNRVTTVTRPYHFIEFDSFIQNLKKKYADPRKNYQLANVHSELQSVQRIMVQNIEDVIHRGEALTMLDDKAGDLAVLSKKYKQQAHYLNLKSSFLKIGAVIILVLLLSLYIKFYVL
ncbi:unnamed protein product [Soboliphyme baturini]|uniref:Vesicle-trafficking protein SEC22b n=1 Tax=Soboliphyme baturini TaxID=241478 RepID=A0A183ICA1_9BILA|nr:unnamed protein product [Soboliphyme baturini]